MKDGGCIGNFGGRQPLCRARSRGLLRRCVRACPRPATQPRFSLCSLTDFSNQVNSTSLNSPTSRGPMATPSLHPSIGPGIGSSLGSPGQLHSPISTLSSPINGMGPPFSVISSPMGPHSMSVPSTPSLGFGTSSPQVRGRWWGHLCCPFSWGEATSVGFLIQNRCGLPAALARQTQGDKCHCRQAPTGGKKQKPNGETKPEASCCSGRSRAAAAAFGAALGGLRGTGTAGMQPSITSHHLSPPVLPCLSPGWG